MVLIAAGLHLNVPNLNQKPQSLQKNPYESRFFAAAAIHIPIIRAAGLYEDTRTGPNQVLRPNKVLMTDPTQVLRSNKDLKTSLNQV